MLQHLADQHGIVVPQWQPHVQQITANKADTGADRLWFACEQFTGERERLSIYIHTGDVAASAGQENLEDTFAASHIKNCFASCAPHHPINALTKNLA